MTKVLMTVQPPNGAPNLQAVKQRYGLSDNEIDADYGVVDLGDGAFTVLVEEEAVRKLAGAATRATGDPRPVEHYSNPRIAHFGPPEPPSAADDNARDADRAADASAAERRDPPSSSPGGHPPMRSPGSGR